MEVKIQDRTLRPRPLRNPSGQALVEYVLLLIIIFSVGLILQQGVRTSRDKMWKRILCEVAPPCPTCANQDSVKAALPGAKIKCN